MCVFKALCVLSVQIFEKVVIYCNEKMASVRTYSIRINKTNYFPRSILYKETTFIFYNMWN